MNRKTNAYAYDRETLARPMETQDGVALSRATDSLGRPAGITLAPDYSLAHSYDAYGRFQSVTSAQSADTNTWTYSYLPGSHLLSGHTSSFGLHTSSFSRSFEPHRDFVTSVENTFGETVISRYDYENDALGRRTAIARSGSAFGGMPVEDSYGYNVRSEVTSARRALADNPNQQVRGFSYDYAYDPIGNRTSSTEYDPGNNALVSSYAANQLNQYGQRTVPGYAAVRGEAATNATVTVNANPVWRLGEYFHGGDTADNSASAVMKDLAIEAVINPPGTNDPDQVSAVTGRVFVAQTPESFQYDDDGNLTQDGRFTYAWDGENRLVAAETRDDLPASVPRVKVEYAYDHRGRMVWKTIAPSDAPPSKAVQYLWDDYNIIAEYVVSDSATNIAYNVWGLDLSGTLQGAGGVGGLLSVTRSSAGVPPATYLPCFDGNGNVSEYNDTEAVVVAHREYSPFGETVAHFRHPEFPQSDFTHWFSTKPWCPVTGLSEYELRKYGPGLGRWLSRDPIGERGGLSLYSMTRNSPMCRHDMLGLVDCECCRSELKKAWNEHLELAKLTLDLVGRERRDPTTGYTTGCLKGVMCQGCSDKPQGIGGWYGYHPNPTYKGGRYIVICCDAGLGFPGTSDVLETLRHELQHAKDWCDGKYEDEDCAGCLCTEVRAFYCSGACEDMESCIAILKASNYFTVHCPCSKIPDKNGQGGNVDEIEALARSCKLPSKTDCAYTRPEPPVAKPTP